MAKILVTGANGLLGVNFCDHLSSGHQILGLTRAKGLKLPFATQSIDLFDGAAFGSVLDSFKPDLIVHTAAMANLEHCESDPTAAELINADLPGKLSTIARERGVKFIHISTDAVFSSDTDKIHTETDDVNPASVYAKTKYQGEQAVLSANPSALVARVNFFGWSITGEKSLAEFFFNHLSAGKACFGFMDVFFSPLFVNDLAELLVMAAEKDLSGVYHVTGSEILSKYQFGQVIAREFGFNSSLISPKSVELSTLTAKRSHNLRLSNAKLSTALGGVIPGVSTGIHEFYTQYQQGFPQKLKSYQQVEKRS